MAVKAESEVVVSFFTWRAAVRECASYIQNHHYVTLWTAVPLSPSPCRVVVLHTYLNTHTYNGCLKFFQGISRLINRLVVWGSSEVQGSRLNPLTERIISGRWAHTSLIAPSRNPSPTWLDLTYSKISPPNIVLDCGLWWRNSKKGRGQWRI